MRVALDDPPLAGRTGRGVRVAVIDSGVHAAHPHISRVAGGVRITAEGEDHDWTDRIGHGTAVAAAILEKAPGVDLFAIRIFEHTLSTTSGALARAVEWAVAHECHLINLSLGGHAVSAGLTVAPRGVGALAVELDWDCAREEMRIEAGPVFHASGLPRPIPGVPAARNLSGLSFAVANVTGFVARLLEGRPELDSATAIERVLVSSRRVGVL